MKGPIAPRNPEKIRACLYAILDKTVAGRKEEDGKIREHIYLEGRLRGQAEFTSGKVNADILDLLQTVKGFRRLVHSIGVTLVASEEEDKEKEAEFLLICYGRTEKYITGMKMSLMLPCNGEEKILTMEDYPVNEEDTVIGCFDLILPVEYRNFIITRRRKEKVHHSGVWYY